MGAVSEISSLLLQLYKLWREHRGDLTITPLELYEKFVRPSYFMLKEIHADYQDMYLELAERIHRDERLTIDTIDWFSRARMRRAADRSELSLTQLPVLVDYFPQISDRIADINNESAKYVTAIQRYFEPEARFLSSEGRIYELIGSPTASRATEIKLIYLYVFGRMEDADRKAMEAEHSAAGKDADQAIETVMRAVTGEIDEEAQRRIEENLRASANIDNRFEKLDKRSHRWSFSGPSLWRFRWLDIIEEHIGAQRDKLSKAMKEVQLRYVRLRILADR